MTVNPSEKQEGRAERSFYTRDVLVVAPELPGMDLVLVSGEGIAERYMITEVEAYRGREDLACHASRGRTGRTEIMYHEGGMLYIYLIYGIYWMLNIVTGKKDNPQAVLIRGAGRFNGPGKLTSALGIGRSFYGDDLVTSGRIWLEHTGRKVELGRGARIGIDYAGEYWKNVDWRYFVV